jgi:hypothetical protein
VDSQTVAERSCCSPSNTAPHSSIPPRMSSLGPDRGRHDHRPAGRSSARTSPIGPQLPDRRVGGHRLAGPSGERRRFYPMASIGLAPKI